MVARERVRAGEWGALTAGSTSTEHSKIAKNWVSENNYCNCPFNGTGPGIIKLFLSQLS